MSNPSNGWLGFYFEIDFLGPSGSVLELTTEMLVIPNNYPIDDCHDQQCFGKLV